MYGDRALTECTQPQNNESKTPRQKTKIRTYWRGYRLESKGIVVTHTLVHIMNRYPKNNKPNKSILSVHLFNRNVSVFPLISPHGLNMLLNSSCADHALLISVQLQVVYH